MKLLIKILLFVLVSLVTNMNVVSSGITFTNIQKVTSSLSFHKEITKSVFKVIENDLQNYYRNGDDLVDYKEWGIGAELVAAKGEWNLQHMELKE